MIVEGILLGLSDQERLDFIEYMVATQPFYETLRLVCMMSIMSGGLKPKMFDQIKKSLVEGYGLKTLLTLRKLQESGLFCPSTDQNARNYSSYRKSFDLMEDTNDISPSSISYVYSGYAPLLVRLIEILAESSEEGIEKIKSMGKYFRYNQLPADKRPNNEVKEILVVVNGGITRAEISALRFLSKRDGGMSID